MSDTPTRIREATETLDFLNGEVGRVERLKTAKEEELVNFISEKTLEIKGFEDKIAQKNLEHLRVCGILNETQEILTKEKQNLDKILGQTEELNKGFALKEQILTQKGEALSVRESNLAPKEENIAKRNLDLDERERNIAIKQKETEQTAQDTKTKNEFAKQELESIDKVGKLLDTRESDLNDRASKLDEGERINAGRTEELAKRDESLKSREESCTSLEKQLNTKCTVVNAKESQLDEREAGLKVAEKEFETKKSAIITRETESLLKERELKLREKAVNIKEQEV